MVGSRHAELAALEAAIAAAPDDDEPRLVWADAVGGERGELVVLQCRLAREDLAAAEHDRLAERASELLAAYGRMWSGFAGEPAVRRCMFRRGFVEAVEANVTEMPWQRVFEIAPLVAALAIRGIRQDVDHRARTASIEPVAFLRQMFAEPAFERLRGIGIDDAALYEVLGDSEWDTEYDSRGDAVLAMIAETDALVGIRSLAIHDRITSTGILALARSQAVTSIERLTISEAVTGDAQLGALFLALPSLRALDLAVDVPLREYYWAIPPTLVELRLHGEDDARHVGLVSAPHLERLALTAVPDHMPPTVRAFDLVYEGTHAPLVHVGTNPREPWGNYGVVS